MISFFFVRTLAALLLLMHPFFISMTELEYDTKDKSLGVSVRIFSDDLENAIRKTTKGKADLLNPAQKATAEKLISNYITQHLTINADGNNEPLKFIGFEVEESSIWSYFQTPPVNHIRRITLKNNILFDYKEQQVNFIHLKAGNTDETAKLDFPDTDHTFIVNW